MNKNLLFFTLFFAFCFYLPNSFGQITSYKSKNSLKLKPKQIKKLTLIQLESRDKKFPDSYLLGMRDDNLILATDIAEKWTDKSLFVKSEINIRNYDYLTMLNRKEKNKKMLIWGTIIGAVGYYFVQRKALPTPYEVRNKRLLGQPTNNGRIEGIMGGITGAGLGMIVGAQIARRRINLKKQRTKAVRHLKEFSFYD